MQRRNPRIRFVNAFVSLGLGLLICGLPALSLAKKVSFNPPSGNGLPGRREGAGIRGNCLPSSIGASSGGSLQAATLAKQVFVTPLIPESRSGLTTSAHPTFFWHVEQNTSATMEFVLYDRIDSATRKEIYKTTFAPDGKPGVVSIRLPETIGLEPLEIGKTYYWTFKLVCNTRDRSGDIRTEGLIQRVQPSSELATKLEEAAPRDRPALYATNGIWYDALASLADLRRAKPDDLTLAKDWSDLLAAVKLGAIAQEPLIQCCQAGINQSTSLK